MALCESESALLPGPCQSEGRWVGPDDKVRCSMHQIQEFGHGAALVRVEDYEPPKKPEAKKAGNGRRTQTTKGAKK